MKRFLLILLAAALMAILFACGGDTTYQALTAALASGDYAAVKAEMNSLSPDYQAEQEELSVYQEKYGTLVGALEAEDYEGAQEALQACIPQPEYIYVDITLDNWQEYFDLECGEYWYVDDYGENQFGGYCIYLTVKEAYRDKLPHTELKDSNGEPVNACSLLDERINIEVELNGDYYEVAVNAEDKQTELGTRRYSGYPHTKTTRIRSFTYNGGNSAYVSGGYFGRNSYVYPDYYEITRIEGKLPLLTE